MKIEIKCDECQNMFWREKNEYNRSQRRGIKSLCSKKCVGINQSKNLRARHKEKLPNVRCAWCQKKFYKNPSKLKLSKSGLYFCCRDHKDKAQRIDGLKELHLPHYGVANGKNDYRRKAFENFPHECGICGWNEVIDVLIVHHKDVNRNNNNLHNLQILCPTCHDILHYKSKTGRFFTSRIK